MVQLLLSCKVFIYTHGLTCSQVRPVSLSHPAVYGRIRLFPQFGKIVPVHLSVLLLNLKLISLLLLVVDISLPVSFCVLFQYFFDIFSFFLQGDNSSFEVFIEVFLDDFILSFFDSFDSFDAFDAKIDFLVSRGNGVLQMFQSYASLMFLIFAFESLDSPFVHLNLTIAILQLSTQTS